MFKFWYILLLYGFLYTFNVVLLAHIVLNLPLKRSFKNVRFVEATPWAQLCIGALSGLPPLTTFFFKVYVFSTANNVYLNLVIFFLLNTLVLYYYLISMMYINTYLSSVLNFKKYTRGGRGKISTRHYRNTHNVYFWFIYLNGFFVFFFEYLNNLIYCSYV